MVVAECSGNRLEPVPDEARINGARLAVDLSLPVANSRMRADQIIGVLVGRAAGLAMRVREHGWGANPRSPPNA